MTPKAFSYPTLAPNGQIFIAPYGSRESLNYMLVMDLLTNKFFKLPLQVTNVYEKYLHGIPYKDKIYFLPYNESSVLVVDINTKKIDYLPTICGKGKWVQPHVYKNKIIALPYGENDTADEIIIIDTDTNEIEYITIHADVNDEKKWHTSQLVGNIIHALPRGENPTTYFPYRLEFNCDTLEYKLIDISNVWKDYDQEMYTNKKYTTIAKVGNKLYAPPYSENPNFDILATYDGDQWHYERTGMKEDSRKYFSHTVAKNGKIYFPPAGHEEDWCKLLIIDSKTDQWYTKDLDISKESKKYFAGGENSKGKLYYMPRGGCACMPVDTWKQYGDLAEILVIDTNDDSYYTIDISEYFTDNTTIEKYNTCVMVNDIIYAFPYGESESFQTILIFDTIQEKVISTIDLNEI